MCQVIGRIIGLVTIAILYIGIEKPSQHMMATTGIMLMAKLWFGSDLLALVVLDEGLKSA